MLYFLVTLAIVACANAESVVHCTDDDLESTLKASPLSLVKFYAPWCGHCKKMAPEFETAAEALLKLDPPVALIKVDCTTQQAACSKYGVSGYPTLKIFRGSGVDAPLSPPEDYSGGRTAPDMIKSMKTKAGPTSVKLSDVSAAETYFGKHDDEAVVVGYFTTDTSTLAKTHAQAADALNAEFSFAHSTDEDVLKKYAYTDVVVVYRPKRLASTFEPSVETYTGAENSADLQEWIRTASTGLCGVRATGDNENFPEPLVAVYYDVDYKKNPKGTNYWRNRVMKVAKKLKEESKGVTFSVSNKDDNAQEVEEFGLKASDDGKPIVGMWDADERKYGMKEAFSVENLEAFVRGVLDGSVEPYLKSAELPEGDDEGVTVVVAKNFESIVNDKTKDVLIEFYAPWCGHCKTLAPKYVELAKLLADEPDIVIAKMDATTNDVPKPYNVKGFPTIYFASKDGKSLPVQYSGGREVDGFLKYLAKEATDELKGYDREGKAKKQEL